MTKYFRSRLGVVLRKRSLINVYGEVPDSWERVTVKPKRPKHWEWRLRRSTTGWTEWFDGEGELNPGTPYRLRKGTEKDAQPGLEYCRQSDGAWLPCLLHPASLEVRKVR